MQKSIDTSTKVQDIELIEEPLWLKNFIKIYQGLAVDNLSNLTNLYHQDITFRDPLHTINGFTALTQYFDNLYQNVSECTFVIQRALLDGDKASIYWTMTYSHKQLNGGKPVSVEGHSLIIGEADKVIYHRDYFDLGQMLYEHIPVLGPIIRWLKRRVN